MNQHVVVAIDAPFGAPSALQVLFGGIRKSCVDSLFPELVSTATSPQYRRTETDMQDQLGFDSKTVLQLSGVYRAFISKFSQVIQSDSWAIFPVKGDLDSAEKTCIECYPRATAKALGLPDEGYKSSRDMGEDRADGIRSARKTIIDGLKLIVAIEQDIEAYLLDNDDAIDAVL